MGVHPDPATQPPHDQAVAEPRVPRPDPAGDRTAAADGEVGPPGADVLEHRQQLGRVEGVVAVHERDVLAVRGQESGMHGGAVPGRRLGDDGGTQPAGDLRRTVRGAVVHDDHRELGRDRGQELRERGGLVPAGRMRSQTGSMSLKVDSSRVPQTARELTNP